MSFFITSSAADAAGTLTAFVVAINAAFRLPDYERGYVTYGAPEQCPTIPGLYRVRVDNTYVGRVAFDVVPQPAGTTIVWIGGNDVAWYPPPSGP